MTAKQIAQQRLTELGCANLPKNIINLIAANFEKATELHIQKLSTRLITAPRIARIFIAEITKQNQKREDYLNMPPPQAEANGLAGDNPPH